MTSALDDPIALGLFAQRISAICEEMGAALKQSAFSPNIKDRLDFSCALFDHHGRLIEQAAAIPVHLGSMAYAMQDVVADMHWPEGQQMVLNDPFSGGTHLPDVTVIRPIHYQSRLVGFAANRAHHADIGADQPGSMPISRTLEEEGLLISPTLVDPNDPGSLAKLTDHLNNPQLASGDFAAQFGANRVGEERLIALIEQMSLSVFHQQVQALNAYGERCARLMLSSLPAGTYRATDYLDNDGVNDEPVRIEVSIELSADRAVVDFAGTASQVQGNLNCPPAVAFAGVSYVFRCLMPAQTPNCAGTFDCFELRTPSGSLLNPNPPAAVAAGNVETSSRVVDVVCRALAKALPSQVADSQGTMNNVAFGGVNQGHSWSYYETIGGGSGASSAADGASAVQTHMTNTLNTPVEVLETNYPVRILQYAVRDGSGGEGQYKGGDGIVREYQFLKDTELTILSERRSLPPAGAGAGQAGSAGINWLNGSRVLSKTALQLKPGDRLKIETPGGGGWHPE